jgi:hypothetical protein
MHKQPGIHLFDAVTASQWQPSVAEEAEEERLVVADPTGPDLGYQVHDPDDLAIGIPVLLGSANAQDIGHPLRPCSDARSE